MRISIFGANGYIGTKLSEYSAFQGAEIVKYSSGTNCNFDKSSGVIDDIFITDEVDVVVYLSQSPFYNRLSENTPHVWGVNVLSAIKVARWAIKCGAKRFIYASTGNVYKPGFSLHNEKDEVRRDDGYGLSKLHAEEALSLLKDEISITCLRLFGVFGPNQDNKLIPNLINSIRNDRPIKLHSPGNNPDDRDGLRLSLCYIDDVVNIIYKLCHLDGPLVINVSSNEVKSIRQICDEIGNLLGINPVYEASNVNRKFDLIADVSNLIELLNPDFTGIGLGLTRTVEEKILA